MMALYVLGGLFTAFIVSPCFIHEMLDRARRSDSQETNILCAVAALLALLWTVFICFKIESDVAHALGGLLLLLPAFYVIFHPFWSARSAYIELMRSYQPPQVLTREEVENAAARVFGTERPAESNDLIAVAREVLGGLWDMESRPQPPPVLPPPVRFGREPEKYAAYLQSLDQTRFLTDTQRLDILVRALSAGLNRWRTSVPWNLPPTFTIAAIKLMENPLGALAGMLAPFFSEECRQLGVGEQVRQIYERNCSWYPDGTADESDLALRRTIDLPLRLFLLLGIDFGIPDRLRTEHGVIVGGTGAGKTQLLESLILTDLSKADPPGIVVIDSKNEMVKRIARLSIFHPVTGKFRDRLVIIDHEDKPALNMFDVPEELVNTRINEIAETMRYFIGGLLGNELSGQMDVLFLPLLHVILRVPRATLHDFVSLVQDPTKYADIIERIPRGPRSFLKEHYGDDAYRATKRAIITRLFQIINESTLDEMFSASRNAVNLAEALDQGKIVLISTDAQSLQRLSPIFGKFWIAQVMNAGLARGSDQRRKRRPIHLYIDECAPYVDDKLATMLTTIRSYGIGLMTAFQGTWQMGTFTRVIQGNTAVKLVSRIDETDAETFASTMHTTKDFLLSQQTTAGGANFALYFRGLPRAVSVHFPFLQLDRWQQMTEADYRQVRASNRARLQDAPSFPGLVAPDPQRPAAPKQPPGRRRPAEDTPVSEEDSIGPSTTY